MKKLISGIVLSAVSTLSIAATLLPVQLINPVGSTSGQTIVSTGASSAPAWGGVGVNGIAAIAANTVLANATASSASPTAFAMPSCSASGNALLWTSGTGFQCGTGYALLASPTFTGTPSAPTATTGTATTQIATTAFVTTSPTLNQPTINGITSGAAAGSGVVGQVISNTASGVSLTSNTPANLVTLSVPAGQWLVQCTGSYIPAGSTTVASVTTGLSPTSATFGIVGSYTALFATLTTGAGQVQPTPFSNVNVSTTTTMYCVGQAGFGTSTMTAGGFVFAIRIR